VGGDYVIHQLPELFHQLVLSEAARVLNASLRTGSP